jgi:hypothetical protein
LQPVAVATDDREKASLFIILIGFRSESGGYDAREAYLPSPVYGALIFRPAVYGGFGIPTRHSLFGPAAASRRPGRTGKKKGIAPSETPP